MSDGFTPDDGFVEDDGFAPESPPKRPGQLRAGSNRWLQKLGEGAVPGFNRLSALGSAVTDPLLGIGEGEGFGERYDRNLRAEQAQSREMQRERPYVSAGLQVAGGIPTAMLTGGGAPAASILAQGSRLGQAAQGAKLGAGYGAMYGAGDAPAGAGLGTLAAHTAGGAVLGGATGGALGAFMPSHVPNQAVARVAAAHAAEAPVKTTGAITLQPNRLRRTAELTIKPTPEATYLRGEGVPLTAGQLNPRSPVGQIEEAATSLRYTGPAIAARRDAAKGEWRQRVLREAIAPGDKKPIPRDVNEAMADIYGRFGPQYDAIREQPVPGEALRDMSASASKVLKGVDERTRAGVKAEIENALTVIGYRPPGGGHAHGHGKPEAPKGLVDQFGVPIPESPRTLKPATAGDVLKVRENIRGAVRDARQAQDFDKLRLLEHAEDVVTETLNAHLSPEAAAALRATDRRYAIYSTLEDAASRAGLGGEFGPKQLGGALKKSLGRRGFVHGKGDAVRNLTDAGNTVFESVSPPTGARLLTVGPLGEWVTGPLVFQMNQPPGRFPMPRLPQPGLPPNSEMAAALAAALQGKPGPRLLPAYGEEER
jgi:hypothetical protein